VGFAVLVHITAAMQERSTLTKTPRHRRHCAAAYAGLLMVLAVFASCGGGGATSSSPLALTGSVSSQASGTPTPPEGLGDQETLATNSPSDVSQPGVACGVERWPVKTLSDQDSGGVTLTPQDTTVSALRALSAPASLPQNSRVPPTELTVFKVTAVAMLAKRESDHDIHLVIANPDNPSETMIVEFPDVACSGASSSAYRDNIKAARDEFDALFSEPGSNHFTDLQAVVQITGVGFFDFLHGQTGVAPNGIELHPVLSITAVGGVTPALPAPVPTAAPTAGSRTDCDPSYPTVCIPPPPPDLNCADIPYRRFQVLPPDPHHFDGNHNGIGCES
jgi:hypothetical protein